MTSAQKATESGDLYLSPFHQMVNQDLNWGKEHYAKGGFAAFPGQYVGIVDKKVHAVGYSFSEVNATAAASAGVQLERVAMVWVDDGRWL